MAAFKSEETVLNLIKEVMEFSLNPREFAALSFNVREAFGHYVVQIKREMYGERIQKTVTVEFVFKQPATWWQHFKQDNLPAWLLLKFPVQYSLHGEKKTVEFDRAFIFPEAYREGHPVLGKFIIHDYHAAQR